MPRHNPYHYSFNSPLVWKDPSGLAPEKEQDRLMGQYTYDIEVAAELYHGQLVENNYNYMLRWADAVDSFFDSMIDWKNSPEAQGGGGGGRTGEDGRGENGTKSPDAEAIDAVENKSTNKQADKNSSKGKKGVFSYGDLVSLFESNFYKTYKTDEIEVVAKRPENLTKEFNTHLDVVDKFFSRFKLRLQLPWFNLNILPFGVIQLKGAKSDFLNLKQTKRYKDGGLYKGEYFEGDDFGNYAYGVAAKASGIHLHEALIGAGVYGLASGSQINWWNIIGFTDEWKDSKMIIRGYFHSYKKFIEGK